MIMMTIILNMFVCLFAKKIESNEEGLLRFLNLILDGIHDIDDKQYNLLSNYLGVIGYELQITTEKRLWL